MSPERNIDCIVGINGSGKSAISRRVSDSADIEYVSASGILKKHYRVLKSSDLEQFSQAELNNKFIELLQHLVTENPNIRFILDTHSVIYREDGTEDVTFPVELYPYIKEIVDVVADPETIIKRIISDSVSGIRERKLITPETVISRINKSSQRAQLIAQEGGFPYYVLENNGDLNRAVEALCQYLVNNTDKFLIRK